jgi:lycopene cyclase domain-containing protein
VPGLYLLTLLVSIAGIAVIDRRFTLAAWRTPGRTAAAIAIGTLFFLAWDAVGITAGVFLKGDSAALLGVDLAPHLPLEEPIFLAFLCYLTLVVHAGAMRIASARRRRLDAPARRASGGPA